ncbi:MAG TPA: hypothetical protein VGU66_16295 [Candidatus Elarobacter sp.]|nr:hypothetical protein [Candidatus Elarobacter sp.]
MANAVPRVFGSPDVNLAAHWLRTPYAVTTDESRSLTIADRARMVGVDGYRYAAVVDSEHHLQLIRRTCCALQEWILSPLSTPVLGAADGDLSAIRIGGIRIGSSVGDVERRFGPAPAHGGAATRGGQVVLRYRHVRDASCSWFYSFATRNSRIRAISVKNAC